MGVSPFVAQAGAYAFVANEAYNYWNQYKFIKDAGEALKQEYKTTVRHGLRAAGKKAVKLIAYHTGWDTNQSEKVWHKMVRDAICILPGELPYEVYRKTRYSKKPTSVVIRYIRKGVDLENRTIINSRKKKRTKRRTHSKKKKTLVKKKRYNSKSLYGL